MKIRNGFVSNSSSSSFVCIVAKSAMDELIATKFDNAQKAFVEQLFCVRSKFGTEVYVAEGPYGDNYYFYEDFSYDPVDGDPEDIKTDGGDVWESVQDLINDLPDEMVLEIHPDAG